MKKTDSYFNGIELRRKFSLLNAILFLAGSILVPGCAPTPTTVVQKTVGPRPEAAREGQSGFLTVYSASIWTTADDRSSSLLSYTDYEVRAFGGTTFKHVVNGDEEPAQVDLPPGHYLVVAQSDTSGTVSVPVAIERGKTTVVHLGREQDRGKFLAGTDKADLVRLPDGQVVGYRARDAEAWPRSTMVAAQFRERSSTPEQPKG